MNERQPVPPSGDAAMRPVVGGSPPRASGAERSASRDREARADSISRLLDALAEYERMVSMLVTAVLGLCLSRRDRGADSLRANRTEEGNRPNG